MFSPYFWLAILIAVGGAYGGGRLQQWHRDSAVFQKKMDDAVAAAQAEKVAIEQARAAERAAAEAEQVRLKNERDRLVAQSRKRIADLDSAIAAMRAPAIGRLLNDTINEAGGAAGSAGKPDPRAAAAASGPDTTIGQWAQWSVDVINLYAACKDQVVGWINFYGKVRAAH